MCKFGLIENASDSLMHALEHISPLRQGTTSDWRKVIVNLAHALELLFKEKLRQIHPAFIYTDVDEYPSREAQAVGAELALSRLRKIGDIRLSTNDMEAIAAVRRKRNEIEHYQLSIMEKEAQVLVGKVLSTIFDFSEQHLGIDWKSAHLKKKKLRILYEYKEFYGDLLEHAENKIEAEEIFTINCSSCRNDTFDVEKGECLVCHHEEDVLDCEYCGEPYLFSSCEYDEDACLCPNCEYELRYTAANFEKHHKEPGRRLALV